MRQSVPRFSRILKYAPLMAPGETEQHDGSRQRHPGYWADLTGLRVKGTAHCET
jgi:hypothetical protein